MLASLRATEPRAANIAAAQRTAFQLQAKEMAQGVSPPPVARLNKWRAVLHHFTTAPKKEPITMFKIAISLMTIIGLFAGGGTMVAAQSSLPDEPLYPLKVWTEDAQLSLTGTENEQLYLYLDFTNRRIQEIQTLFETGTLPPEEVVTRLDEHLQNAFTLVANFPDEEASLELLQIQTQLQQHQQTISQIHGIGDDELAMLQIRTRIQNMLEVHAMLAQNGATDLTWLRNQLQEREQEQNRHQNGDGYDGNAWTTGTPTPGSGYGPGPFTTGTPEPGGGYGPGEPGNIQNPWTTGTPTPGSGYGPGNPDPPNNPGSNNPSPPGNGNNSGDGNGNHP